MSRKADDEIPQPGAVAGSYEANKNSRAYRDVTQSGWPDLPASQAVNFVKDTPLEPVTLVVAGRMGSQELYRNWGDPAWDLGSYWTDKPFETEDDFYGLAAVEKTWNSGQYLALLKNTGLLTEIKAWRGVTAVQPAIDMATKAPSPNYHLPGGVIQTFIPYNTLPYVVNTPSAWAPSDAPPGLARLAPKVAPPAPGTAAHKTHYEALADLVDHLAAALGGASGALANAGARIADASARAKFAEQAAPLERIAAGLRANASNLTSTGARAQARLLAQSLIPLARYLDGTIIRSGPGGAIDGAVADIVKWACAIDAAAP